MQIIDLQMVYVLECTNWRKSAQNTPLTLYSFYPFPFLPFLKHEFRRSLWGRAALSTFEKKHMKKILSKFLAGWIDARSMQENPEWRESWIAAAEAAEEKGFDLVVFRIPKKSKQGNGTIEVERLLQNMFPLNWNFPFWEKTGVIFAKSLEESILLDTPTEYPLNHSRIRNRSGTKKKPKKWDKRSRLNALRRKRRKTIAASIQSRIRYRRCFQKNGCAFILALPVQEGGQIQQGFTQRCWQPTCWQP